MPIERIDLRGKVIVLRQNCVPPHSKFHTRVRRVAGGPGANSNAQGSTVWMETVVTGGQDGYKRKDIQGYINDDEKAAKFLMWNSLSA